MNVLKNILENVIYGDEFQINEDDLKKFENTITSYDKNLAKLLKPN